KFLIGFTCKKCNKRSYKLISKKSYYEGVVIIRCDQCKNLHLIADHLGWYDSMNKFGTIEDYFKRQ
ncbi:zf-DNL-domain-containing protein, partial [Anaeromyces robustus]